MFSSLPLCVCVCVFVENGRRSSRVVFLYVCLSIVRVGTYTTKPKMHCVLYGVYGFASDVHTHTHSKVDYRGSCLVHVSLPTHCGNPIMDSSAHILLSPPGQ